jgi:hypothetical protein
MTRTFHAAWWPAAAASLIFLAGCSEPVPQPPGEAVGPGPSGHASGYAVRIDPENPQRLLASLVLVGDGGMERTAFVRGQNFGLESQIVDPRCDGFGLVEASDGQWLVPGDCQLLSWAIELDQAVANGVDTSLQRSLVFAEPAWWLLSEPTSLLRISGPDEESLLRLRITGLPDNHQIAGASQVEEGVWRLPGINHAPEFFAFGELVTEHHDIGRLKATYVIDDQARFQRLNLPVLHAQALAYLGEVFQIPVDLPPEDRHLLVVWLGIDETLGHAGGAAGSRSFLANYIDGEEEGLALNLARTLLILAHEQVHQLHDLTWTGGTPGPTWLGESIAHYYGLKALATSGLPDDAVAAAMNAFIDPDSPPEAGLVEYQRRYDDGDLEAYYMFYSQGATFWSEVDRVLLSTDSDNGGLDTLMPTFVQAPADGPGLPSSFQELLMERGGAEIETLLVRYVGD